MEEYIQVLTATEKEHDAERIVRVLVEKRLAGCAQIVGPITSTYWWNDNVEVTEEWLCLIKTRKTLYDKLERAIKEMHPYETPEIMAVPIVAGSKEYFDWLANELTRE